MATQVGIRLGSPLAGLAGQNADPREGLVRRVLESSTFEHSPKLRAFLEYVCRCALNNEPAAATESQIGIHVFGRPPGYNANEDNIVRSQARLLRLKLEHHFANEGTSEPVIIVIPKGRYLPAFAERWDLPAHRPSGPPVQQEGSADHEKAVDRPVVQGLAGAQDPHENRPSRWRFLLLALTVLGGLATIWFYRRFLTIPGFAVANPSVRASSRPNAADDALSARAVIAAPITDPGIRIAAGGTAAFVDTSGRHWYRDEDFEGGVSKPGPEELFPPVSDPAPFRNIREGVTVPGHAPMGFQYDIPVRPGVYELRLYFADPIRYSDPGFDGQQMRHFQVNLNGKPILTDFDAIADAGSSAVDIRTFRDVSPAQDGELHLDFLPSPNLPILSGLELTPGVPGALRPIRFSVHNSELVDRNGTRWSGDQYFVDGKKVSVSPAPDAPKVSPLYTEERFGNFSYSIPVPPGSYTVRLHFMEAYWGPSVPMCSGPGCRIFDVTCNGQTLLEDFDIFKTAGGDFQPVIKTFHGLHPNGQGKLLLSFSPRVDYAEVRAIEVLDEAGGGQKRP